MDYLTNSSTTQSATFEGMLSAMRDFGPSPKPLPRRIFVASDLYVMLMKDRHSGGVQAFSALDGVEITESPLLPDGKWLRDTDIPNPSREGWPWMGLQK